MDAWHVATVAVLAIALGGEVIGAYGKQRRLFEERSLERQTLGAARSAASSQRAMMGVPWVERPGRWWRWLWLGRYAPSVPLCTFFRGCTRLTVLTYVVIHFAAEREFPWSPWIGG